MQLFGEEETLLSASFSDSRYSKLGFHYTGHRRSRNDLKIIYIPFHPNIGDNQAKTRNELALRAILFSVISENCTTTGVARRRHL